MSTKPLHLSFFEGGADQGTKLKKKVLKGGYRGADL